MERSSYDEFLTGSLDSYEKGRLLYDYLVRSEVGTKMEDFVKDYMHGDYRDEECMRVILRDYNIDINRVGSLHRFNFGLKSFVEFVEKYPDGFGHSDGTASELLNFVFKSSVIGEMNFQISHRVQEYANVAMKLNNNACSIAMLAVVATGVICSLLTVLFVGVLLDFGWSFGIMTGAVMFLVSCFISGIVVSLYYKDMVSEDEFNTDSFEILEED